jgi:hypothetical protein
MNDLKVALVWNSWDIQNSLIYSLIKQVSKKNIKIVNPSKADFIIYGPYNWDEKLFHFYRFLKRKIKSERFSNFVDSYQKKLINTSIFNRKYKPLTLFYCLEPLPYDYIEADYYISYNLGIDKENHLYDGLWKDLLDWSHEKIFRGLSQSAQRLGRFVNIDELMVGQGPDFLKKERKMCLFAGHMTQPRKIIYETFLKHFQIDVYGMHNNKNADANNNFKKIDIMKKYAFNLCPENKIFPGYTSNRHIDAFVGKCLPIYWADQNIDFEFNIKSFINLNDHFKDNFANIINSLKDDIFLRKYTTEPILLKRPNLDRERKFIEKILNNF